MHRSCVEGAVRALLCGLLLTACASDVDGPCAPSAAVQSQALEPSGMLRWYEDGPDLDGRYNRPWATENWIAARHVLLGSAPSADDLAVTWRALHDGVDLYVLVQVYDDVHRTDDRLPAWEQDSIEIYLDGDGSRGETYDGRNDLQLVLRTCDHPLGYGVRSVRAVPGLRCRSSLHDGWRDLQVAIPLASIGLIPGQSRLGIEVQVNDDDDGGGRDAKVGTFAATDDAWQRPLAFGSFVVQPAAPFHPALVYSVRDGRAPVIDGVDEQETWNEQPVRRLKKALVGGAHGAPDLAADWRALWDTQALYVFVDVRDERLVSDSSEPWHDDAVELFVDFDFSRGARYDGVDDGHFVYRVHDGQMHLGLHSYAPTAPGFAFAMRPRDAGDGYTLEAAIPWSTLGGYPHDGRVIGLEVQVDDDDDGGPRDQKLATYAPTDDAWQRPEQLGQLRTVHHRW